MLGSNCLGDTMVYMTVNFYSRIHDSPFCTKSKIEIFLSLAQIHLPTRPERGFWRHPDIYLSVRIFMPPRACGRRHYVVGLSVRPSVRPSGCPSVCPSVCLSVWITFFFEWEGKPGRGVIQGCGGSKQI